jgi:predicted dehydrogenase
VPTGVNPVILRVAIVGCGWAAEWQVHDGFMRLPHLFTLVACCDTNALRARSFAEKHGIPQVVPDYTDLLAQAGIDVIVVCTPPALHCSMVVAALQAGRHVICEKPFVASLAECDKVVSAEAESRGRVMPIFQYRFGDGIARVRHGIRSGLVGKHFMSVVETAKKRGSDYYAVAWRGKIATELGGVLVTQAIHIHDLLTWLVGPVAAVSCFKTTRVNPIEVEDCAVASIRLLDGSLASLSATLGSARQATRIRLYFENATFERECFDEDSRNPANEPWVVIPRSREIGLAIDAKMAEIAPQNGWFVRQFELFHASIVNAGPFPVTLEDARTSIELITAMFHSDETGETVVLPIPATHPKYAGWTPASSRVVPQ